MKKKEINLINFEEEFFLFFGVDEHSINAETLAKSLLNFTKSLKQTEAIVNCGYELEIIVEALGEGSFKVKLKQIRKSLNNVFSKKNLTALSISILAAVIYDLAKPDESVNIIVNTNEYIVETATEKIILPREAEKYYEEIKTNDSINKSIEKTFDSLDNDSNIKNFEISKKDSKRRRNRIIIEQPLFQNLKSIVPKTKDERTIVKEEILVIIKAILEKGKRKWEFLLNGNRIGAPISDDVFFDKFIAHHITIAPGDALKVKLLTTRILDTSINLYVNHKYEIVEVIEHLPKSEQLELL